MPEPGPDPDDAGRIPGPEPEPSRADLTLWAQALRQDWPIPASVKKRLLQAAINLVDPADPHPNAMPPSPRVVTAALRVIAQFGHLSVRQQALDLARERHPPPAEDTADARLALLDRAESDVRTKKENSCDPTATDSGPTPR